MFWIVGREDFRTKFLGGYDGRIIGLNDLEGRTEDYRTIYLGR